MNFSKVALTSALSMLLMGSQAVHAEEDTKSSIGIVNFHQCVTESKLGKAEQQSLENVKQQMGNLIKDIETQLNDLAAKFGDEEYLDGLSPEAEQEMKAKYKSLKEEHDRYQAQFYQVMQQANMKLYQTVSGYVNEATKKIANDQDLSLVINKDACFSFKDSDDITTSVIDTMDKSYEKLLKQSKDESKQSEDKKS